MGPWLLAFMLMLFLVAGGIYVVVEVPARLRRGKNLRDLARAEVEDGRKQTWQSGDDLLRYPKRLEQLEGQLHTSITEAEQQIVHLERQAEAVGEKEGRDELAERYRSDANALTARLRHMERVLGLVWRTRAALLMRAHLAITARRKPRLEHLPDVDGAAETVDLEEAAGLYIEAASEVRDFVRLVSSRRLELASVVPDRPARGKPPEGTETFLGDENKHIDGLYADLHERMDQLADVLGYLADRCRTRRVIEGATAELSGAGEGEALMDEVTEALAALNDMARAGDLLLADSVVDSLAEDISQLEKAGLEAQAETEAAMEVARLLEEFKR